MKERLLKAIDPLIDSCIKLVAEGDQDTIVGRMYILAGNIQNNEDILASIELSILAQLVEYSEE